MHDPRKPVMTPDWTTQMEVLGEVHKYLLAATDTGAKAMGINGASFVIIGMSVWSMELAELDGRAAAKLMRALADLVDPRTNHNQKVRAEKDRSQAARALFASLDLMMAEAGGNG